jgi:two-component system sporulation sensor kinase A
MPGFFQNILEQSNVSVIIIDDKSEVMFWNIASEEMFGFTEEEVTGKPLPIFIDKDECSGLMQKIDDGEQIGSFDTQLQHISGNTVDVSLAMDCIKDENNEVIGYSILSRDISEQKQTVESLKENAEKFKTVLVDCCPEKIEEVEKPKEIEEAGPSCPVDYSKLKKEGEKKSCCGDN